MKIMGFFSITTDGNMFHEYSSRQRPLLPEPGLRFNRLATTVP